MLIKQLVNEMITYNTDGTIKHITKRYKFYSDSGYYIRKKGTDIKRKQVYTRDSGLNKFEETDVLIEV